MSWRSVAVVLVISALSFVSIETAFAEAEFDEFKITNINRTTYQVYMKGNPNRLRLGEWLVSVLKGGKTCFLKVNTIKSNWVVGAAKTCRYKDLLRKGMVARYYIETEDDLAPAQKKALLAKAEKKKKKKKNGKRKKRKKRNRKKTSNRARNIGLSFYRNLASDVDLKGGVKGGGVSLEGEEISEGAFGFGIEYRELQTFEKLIGWGAGLNYELKRNVDSRTIRDSTGNHTVTNFGESGPSFTMLIAFLEANVSTPSRKFYGSFGVNWSKADLSNYPSSESADGGFGWQLGGGFRGFSRKSFLKDLALELSFRKYVGERSNTAQDFDSVTLEGFMLRAIYHPFGG